ncbi:hypothetical protein AWM68_17425 [Fictibacillus phosphorivorans]|uniref:Uncharacterized protein n=1 Tax=Fictibacillus phosphorivorans TaxID=1221500 RepID=A0A165NWG3_9BACL|nr:hypothetical protein [Fictibacillus phosphorivorans]KZE67953.1 hypothetical protein AWM68_17425 [Fictibacillus phosphorivorans]
MKKLKNFIFLFAFIFGISYPLEVYANPAFGSNGNGPTMNDQLGSWTEQINGLAPTVSYMISALFTIMFLVGVVRMGYSIITKTGQVMKFSTGLLIWVPISFFFIRIMVIILFTTDTNNVTLLANDLISLIKTTGYFTSIGMVLIGLVFFYFFKLIDQPEFGRWSKRLWVSAVLLTFITSIMPYVLGAA